MRQGFWKGGKFTFTFTIPSDYPHSPPKTLCSTKARAPTEYLIGVVELLVPTARRHLAAMT
jgi:ubiquitin-conjugating enzyme E2 M